MQDITTTTTPGRGKLTRYTFYGLTALLVSTYGWLHHVFGHWLTIEQIFFHFAIGLNGLKGIDTFLVFDALKRVALPTVLAVMALYGIGVLTARISASATFASLIAMPRMHLLMRPLLATGRMLTGMKFSIFLFVLALILFLYLTQVLHFIRINLDSDHFTGLYHPPQAEAWSGKHPQKNLLLIYVESLERTVGNPAMVGIDALEPLKQLGGVEVPSFPSAPGTNWTIAGMLSSQCSIPLKPFFYNKFGRFSTEQFFPNVTCLGDVLQATGYQQYFLVGHGLTYSGVGKFYKTHGFQQVLGRDEWIAKGVPESELSSWGGGLHDDTLLSEARKIIRSHDPRKGPFNLTLVTEDNHFPEGLPSPRCSDEDKALGLPGVFRCNSRFIADFIRSLEREGFLKNTVVIVMGDHPFMSSAVQDLQYFREDRHVYFNLVKPSGLLPKRSSMTHFDVAPTVLDLLGLGSTDRRFGLGISLFADLSADAYATHQQSVLSESILSNSTTYDAFWKPRPQPE